MKVLTRTVRPSASTRGSAVSCCSSPRRPGGSRIVCSSVRSDRRHTWTARAARLEVHVARGRDDAIERRQDREAVRPHARIDRGHGGAGRADHPAVEIELDEPAGLVAVAAPSPTGTWPARGRSAGARSCADGRTARDRRRSAPAPAGRRRAEIEDEGPAGVEAVGPEDAAGRHRRIRCGAGGCRSPRPAASPRPTRSRRCAGRRRRRRGNRSPSGRRRRPRGRRSGSARRPCRPACRPCWRGTPRERRAGDEKP